MEINLPQIENRVLNFWKKFNIFEKTLEKNKRNFVFYEGPPTVNAPPGLHHVLSRIYKDLICRLKTMQGFRVERKAGWDTHGLPVEIQIEKKLGLKSKKEIEKFGVEKFNKECKKSIREYKKIWEKLTERIGFWIDLKKPYITYDSDYIESLWFILKKIWKKGLLYRDFKVLPYCPRCGTPLSSHEVAQEYQRIKEPAIYVKFKILNPDFEKTSLLIWTTTPWTLPGNVAVAISPEAIYSQLKINGESLILAKERINDLGFKGEIIRDFKGKELIGLRYQPPFDFYQPNLERERIWEILPANFVSLEEGTGLVHIAPAFGEEDMDLIKTENRKSKIEGKKEFPIILNVDEEGKFKLEVKKWARMFVKDADPLIIEDLKKRELLFKEEIYEHDYPFCWRCKTPLLYYAKKSWFIKVSAVKEKLIRNNQKIKWYPDYIKEGRFGEWLREIKDWVISRERYWGTPLPIWQCKSCTYQEVIGSRKDLIKKKFSMNEYIVLRHGESEMNKRGILISTLPEKISCPLTEEGKEEVKKAAEILKKEKIDLIFSSDLLRARQTAEIVSREIGVKPIFSKMLRDIKAGIFEGKDTKEHHQFWKSYEEKFEKRPKGGENYQDVKLRIYKFLIGLEKKYKGKKILIISHQRPLAMLEGATKGFSVEEFKKKIEPRKMKTGEVRKIEFRFFPYDENGKLDLHRPYVDEIKFFCPKCHGLMERVFEIADCWFDSGAMPFAQFHWPFEKNLKSKGKGKKLIPPKLFPADYIAEGVDQTRGWFYTLLAVSTLLGFGTPYKNVLSLGHVLDEKGEKMSKSKGNVVDPFYLAKKYGADAIRWYFFTVNQPWDPKLFSEKDVFESLRKFIFTLWNCYAFYENYVPRNFLFSKKLLKPNFCLNRWILSRLNNLILETTKKLKEYDIVSAARKIENFVIEDLSLWYIRRSREKFQMPEDEQEFEETASVLRNILLTTFKLLAPFLPFLSDYLYQKTKRLNFNSLDSVHLESWPRVNKKLIDKELEEKMEKAREIVRLALAERQKLKIKVRQCLNELQIPNFELEKEKEILKLIEEEVNVKKISFGKELKFDTKITPELEEEGKKREFIRKLQQMRKEMRLKPKDKILLFVACSSPFLNLIKKHSKEISKKAKIKEIYLEKELKECDYQREIEVDGERVIAKIKKIH